MTSASVKDAVYGIGTICNENTAKSTESKQSKEHDFSKIMNQVKDKAQKTVYQPNQQMAEKKTASQPKEVSGQEVKEDFRSDEPKVKEDIYKKESVSAASQTTEKPSDKEPVDEKLEEAVEETVKEIMDEVEEVLEVSEEELVEAMQLLGLQPIDLLNPDNMAAIMTALTGEDSTIQLVMDEDMYLTLQDLMQMVDEKTKELLSNTGLSDEELEAVMDQLKLLINQKLSEEGNDIGAQNHPFEQSDMLNQTVEMAEDGPVIVNENANAQNSRNAESAQDAAEEVVEGTQAERETGKNEDSLFRQQQENMQGFQNTPDELAQLAPESKLQDSQMPNTESILKQLADYVKIQNGEELTEMELQLHPASLGNVHVMLSTKGGVVTAQLTTENEVVKNAIESQVSQLKLNLEEQGVKVEAIEVSVASHQMERNLEQNAGEQKNQQQTEETNGIHRIRKTSINLNSYENEEELIDDIGEPDDATKIAMEMMAIGGNRMDLLA